MSRLLLPFFISSSALAFEVLDVGAPRTGTQSMHNALHILGYLVPSGTLLPCFGFRL